MSTSNHLSTETGTQPARSAIAFFDLRVSLTAVWNESVGRVLVSDRGSGFSLHLDVEQAAKLAADLISAIAESGAGEVPPELLHAFGAHDAALLRAGEIAGAALARGEQP